MKLIILLLLSLNLSAQERKLSILGLTVHGLDSNEFATKDMKNKITSNGKLAINPQFNITHVFENSIQNFSAVIDCYAHPAIYFGKGKIYKVEQNLSLGYMLGVYIRQWPANEIFGLGRVGLYQVIPTPSFLLEYQLNEKLFLRVNSNLIINFVDLAWRY